MTSKVEMRESFLFRGLYKELLRHFYVTLISLRSQRVVVFLLLFRERQPRHCRVTLPKCGVDRPCRILLHHGYVRALPLTAK